MKLNELRDNSGAKKCRTRRGRGIGEGKGKTAGRGHKGQKSRSGSKLKGQNGGQMSLFRQLPKRGFNSRGTDYTEINLRSLTLALELGKIDPNRTITEDYLYECGVVSKRRKFVKVLGQGDLPAKLNLVVANASDAAILKILERGGTVTTYNKILNMEVNFDIKNSNEVDEYFQGVPIFGGGMNYEIISNKGISGFELSILFWASAEDQDLPDLEKVEAIVDLPSHGIRDRLLEVGSVIQDSPKSSCEFNFSLSSKAPSANSADISDDNVIDLLILYRNRMVHKRRIEIPLPK